MSDASFEIILQFLPLMCVSAPESSTYDESDDWSVKYEPTSKTQRPESGTPNHFLHSPLCSVLELT